MTRPRAYAAHVEQVEVIILDGPLVGEEGFTVEEPRAGGDWPEATWKQDREGPAYRYVFVTMSNGPPEPPGLSAR